ncbi:MAG TPA: polysaccharide deacetylase family protein [Blastocatellia bacterium]|jgi:peptidoglycan/xylan/chitin deacetylase (PgdA/CDA1 family)|nr:polysaccharide deacetylase family protein [Blastocatellia bacterium]
MNRRNFIRSIACATTASGVGGATAFGSLLFSAKESPRVAITMDDFSMAETPRLSVEERNRRVLDALARHSDLKAALFVAGKNCDNEQGKRMLGPWNDRKHTIANHSYSHHYYNSKRMSFQVFSEDALRGEAVIKDFSRFKKLFRFPYLKEGDTAEKRDLMRAFLKKHGYRTGHVTIDASDWYVDDRLRKRLEKEPDADLSPYRNYYLDHIRDRATYYDDLSRKVLGRSVKHTLLVHFNLLNALFLDDLLSMFENRGWKLIDADEAFEDPVFSSAPNILPAGESIVWALAKQAGRFDSLLRYPGEDGEYEKEKMDRLGL